MKLLSKEPSINSLIKRCVSEREVTLWYFIWYSTVQLTTVQYSTSSVCQLVSVHYLVVVQTWPPGTQFAISGSSSNKTKSSTDAIAWRPDVFIMQVLSSEWVLPVQGREGESIISNILVVLPSCHLISNKLFNRGCFIFTSFYSYFFLCPKISWKERLL